MVKKVTMRRADGSVTVTIPKEMAERHQNAVGEEGYIIETDRGLLLSAYDPTFERAMAVYARGAH